MITRDSIKTATHDLIDRLADRGDSADYYALNHLTAQDFEIMAQAIEAWLKLHKIDIQ